MEKEKGTVITYEDVSVSYDGVDVLKDFSLDIARGDKVLVYGKSGIGKSTILKLLLGFARPDRGAIYFDGVRLDHKSVWEVRKKVAYVSQDLDFGGGRVSDFIDAVFRIKANAGRHDGREERQREVMAWLELDEKLLEKSIPDLSGGEKQRFSLAVSLLLEREIFLLDEVTSAVDPEMKGRIADYFASREGKTVLAVSHDVTWLHRDGLKVIMLGG